ncbi:MAG: L-fucose isomerase [Paraclostridium sordellii]|uniref:L-fucose isomerase n=1 Tax=Paraclostridium sordellii TaxID=1505 RepID=A0ABM9RNM2_PARSO|nr:L-fucose isomerase [Paeniclostridium sordellii]AUN14351.1 L-fucose isomerase [Paeniclostridium sordellii]CEJ73644.1 L-fucose isomerase [[Clostridium] sordellii] [Paeniclostridium sordellii]CEN69192.1 L-fucose isomerase [[Clostridium] sordellii] [Paeniclostridium sordellii]CEN72460.1 L-fucose isomerase [[Clostridium] sordellii] [Paeniclostridium sordellii]CEO23921.1 L-fucose isomerase [[Clostridium] sordellii] [Paeniclostridium sordellii]
MAKSRLIGEYPVIGIRPTIDARRGVLDVRGSLEEQTMTMAKSAAKLFEENLKYSNGEPVKVVIADTTIGRVPESAACQDKFRREGVDITLTVTPCWCYGSETMDMDPMTIKGVWGFNGTERPGAVYLASVLATHAQKGLPAFGIYGHDVQDADATEIPQDVKEKLLRFGRAAVAAASMRGKSYLQIGSICMGIGGSIIDSAFIEEYLGMRVESVDETEVIRRMTEEIYDKEEFERALKWTKEKCIEGFDKNPEHVQKTREQKDKDWEFVVKMMCIIKDLMNGNENLPKGCEEERLGHNAIAAGFQGQRQWTDFYPNCDFPEALLNTSFDWNGAREPYILATENDVLNGIGMLFGKLLTNTPQIFSDVRTYWSPEAVKKATGYELEGVAKESDGFIHLINSGASCLDACGQAKDENGNGVMKAWYDITQQDQDAILKATTWNAADNGYFRGGGYSSRFLTEAEMPVTMMRLNLVKGLGPVVQLVEGYTVKLPDEVSDKLWKRTDYTWPCTWFAPRLTGKGAFKSAYDVMNNWGANHGAISYGHIGADIITLCSMLRIPVSMHNIDEEKVFRPAAWNAFGMDKEGQDYRACQAYGPMYK